MFSNLLPASTILFRVSYSDYATKHYLKEFMKKYKGKQWEKTEISIFEDLRRLRIVTNKTQLSTQIDELKYNNGHWLFKYDFRIAGTNESPKTSGHRVVGYIDNDNNVMKILIIYSKTDLPKNKGETTYIYETIKDNFPDLASLFSF